jgi:hypothetical protein
LLQPFMPADHRSENGGARPTDDLLADLLARGPSCEANEPVARLLCGIGAMG